MLIPAYPTGGNIKPFSPILIQLHIKFLVDKKALKQAKFERSSLRLQYFAWLHVCGWHV
jgi:hypothetical protein